MSQSADLALVFKLLSQSSSLSVVSDFLKAKGLSHSAGSWDEMFKLRLEPGIQSSQISVSDVLALLRSAEEFGKQHIFLYRTTPQVATQLMDRGRIGQVMASLGLTDLLTAPRTFEFPAQPSFADARWLTQQTDIEFILKEIETREANEYKGTTVDGNSITKHYEKVVDRGVNVVRLRRNGDLEIRLQSRRGSSRYVEDMLRFSVRLKPFLNLAEFAPVSLLKAKTTLWSDRAKLASKIRYSELIVKNDENISLRASAGAVSVNVAGSQAAETSVNSFLDSDGYCDSSNIWFVKGAPLPARDVHVVIDGEAHEFSVPTNCSEADYEYVLSEIRALNT